MYGLTLHKYLIATQVEDQNRTHVKMCIYLFILTPTVSGARVLMKRFHWPAISTSQNGRALYKQKVKVEKVCYFLYFKLGNATTTRNLNW